MKLTWSKSFEFDLKWLTDIAIALFIWLLSIYSTNTDLFNEILAQYIDKDLFTVITVILAYAVKKYLKDYSK